MEKIDEVHPYLYHYTRWDALVGILQNNTMWATHVKYLNDTSEYNLATDYLSKKIVTSVREKLISASTTRIETNKFIEDNGGLETQTQILARDIINGFYNSTGDHFYVASFCGTAQDPYESENGLLSQWRGYGGDLGFCIVFNTKRLFNVLQNECDKYFYLPSHLSDVVYSHDTIKLQEEFESGLKSINKYVEGFLSSAILGIAQPQAANAQLAFMQIATRFKHQGFHEEREVRIVVAPIVREAELQLWRNKNTDNSKSEKKIEYRRLKNLSAPYVQLFGRSFEPLPIERIIIGPSQNGSAAAELIRRIANGRNIEISESKTPYV